MKKDAYDQDRLNQVALYRHKPGLAKALVTFQMQAI